MCRVGVVGLGSLKERFGSQRRGWSWRGEAVVGV